MVVAVSQQVVDYRYLATIELVIFLLKNETNNKYLLGKKKIIV